MTSMLWCFAFDVVIKLSSDKAMRVWFSTQFICLFCHQVSKFHSPFENALKMDGRLTDWAHKREDVKKDEVAPARLCLSKEAHEKKKKERY